MLKSYYVDTETCGLDGLPVLLQYAIDDGPVQVVHLWTEPIDDIVGLIEDIVDNRFIAHNAKFDWFHLSKLYNICKAISDLPGREPSDTLNDYARDFIAYLEYEARNGLCLKPRAAVDTLIFAQRGEAQSAVMESKPIYVRQVPIGMAENIRVELENNTNLPWILFAGRADQDAPLWTIAERKNELTGEVDDSWVDLKLSFAPSNGLKDLCKFLLGHEVTHRFDEIALPKELFPAEEGFAPYALLLSDAGQDWLYNGKQTWPALIGKHIEHWANDAEAMEYAIADIDMLRKLYEFFGSPENDDDSMLACQVASVRIHGFAVDLEQLATQKAISQAVVDSARLNVNSPNQVKAFLAEALDEMEFISIMRGCDKKRMEELRKEYTLEEEEECFCMDPNECGRCEGRGVVGPGKMPIVGRIDHIEEIRMHTKRIELYDKLILAKRAYCNFNIIGAKSGRMSGTSGLNFQGIGKVAEVRSIFTLADDDWILSGGDYDSQELAILATTSSDDDLLDDIKGGKSLHGLMAAELFNTTYEEIMANKDERYDKAKACVYLIAYGGTAVTMARNAGLPLDVCQKGLKGFLEKYAKMGLERKLVAEQFSALTQDENRKFHYEVPDDPYVESIYGFRRYFHNEYAIQGAIIGVAQNMPEAWQMLKINVQRKEGKVQTICGAIYSALTGAAFSVQNRIVRAALNHKIQSAGRSLTLGLQSNIWKLQPQGIHPYRLCLMSIHDESVVTSSPEVAVEVKQTVLETLREQAKRITMIAMDWGTGLASWYGVKKMTDDPESDYYCDNIVSCGWAEKVEAI